MQNIKVKGINQNSTIKAIPADLKSFSQNYTSTKDGRIYNTTFIPASQDPAFCNDEVPVMSNFAISLNQNLTKNKQLGLTANPKTLIPPVVVPQIYDLDYWKDNELINFSQINSADAQQDMYLSGYAESTCCGYFNEGTELVPEGVSMEGDMKEGYCSGGSCGGGSIKAPRPVQDAQYIPTLNQTGQIGTYKPNSENYCRENINNSIKAPRPVQDTQYVPTLKQKEGYIKAPRPVQDAQYVPMLKSDRKESYGKESYGKESYEPEDTIGTYTTVEDPSEVFVRKNESGWVNDECGYNPEQVYQAGLPSNLAVGNCQQDPKLKRFNENIFTQTVTPGVYTRNQVNEPINANIGISFQQQFEPTTCVRNDKGLIYTQHDPRIMEPVEPVQERKKEATYDTVFDPRFSGYGTSYRSYYEPVTGQSRFMYEDVNAVRMPNYITRSNVDFLPFSDTYGSVKQGEEMGNKFTPIIKDLVQDSYLRNSLEFRNDITERAMRKINSEAWQRRQSPFSTNQLTIRPSKR
jgi:hypothetical protein